MDKRRAFTGTMAALGISIGGTAATAQSNGGSVDLLPLLSVSRPASSEPPRSPVGGYVRFWIERDETPVVASPSAADERLYSAERRNWLARFLVGRNTARILTARLVVNRVNVVTQTVTLASASHDSNRRQGENWASELGERRFLTPYFRVDQGTTASIEVALSASTRIDPDITRNLLSIVERGARLAAPKAPLVTALNATRITETSDFIDSSVSRLFGEALAERSLNDFAAEGWFRGASPLATISAGFPMGTHIWGGLETRNVGSWRVRVSEPIVSIFSPVMLRDDAGSPEVCPAAPTRGSGAGAGAKAGPEPAALTGPDRQACFAFVGLVPSRVLGLQVGDNINLGQALRGDTGVTAALQRFANSSSSKATPATEAAREAAREICVLVAERAEALGLNSYDGAAALWAFASNGGVASSIASQIWAREDCATARAAQRIGLTLSIASPTQDTPSVRPQTSPGPAEQPQANTPQPPTP